MQQRVLTWVTAVGVAVSLFGSAGKGERIWERHVMMEPSKPPPRKSSMVEVMRAMGPYMDIGLTFVVTTGGGAWLGYWADRRFGTTPWLFLLGAVLGITIGFYHFFSVVLRK